MRMIGFAVFLGVLTAATAIAIDCTTDPRTGTTPCPIVVNFAHGTYQLSGAEAPVTFDFYATGQPVRMGWTSALTDQAFVTLDRNHNATIDDGTELFGNVTPLLDGRRASNGFDALAEFDHNRDSVIDVQDAVWLDLLLWRDANHDGVSQSNELTPVRDSSLMGIGLNYHFSGRVDQSGNAFRFQSNVWVAGGREQAITRPVYDIFFVPVP